MAVTVVTAAGTNAIPADPSTTGITVTHGMSLVNGDILVAFVAMGDDDPSAFTSTSGGTWSNDTTNLFASSGIGNDIAVGVLWRVVTNAAGEPSTYTFLATGATSQKTLVAQVIQVRGGDTANVRDGNGAASRGSNDFTPPHANYATAYNNSLLLLAHAASMADGTTGKAGGAPSGASLTSPGYQYQQDTASTAGFDVFIETASQATTSAGTQTINAWTGTADDSASEWAIATIAIREKTLVTGSSVSAFTASLTDAGRLTAKTSAAAVFTAGEVTAGRLTAKTAAAQELVFAAASRGVRTVTGSSSVAADVAATTAGTTTVLGVVGLTVTWAAATDGSASGGATTLYGTVAAPFTLTTLTAGKASVYYHPLLDSQDGAWTTQAGGTNLSDQLDEHVVDDADYIRSELRPVDSACRMKLEPAADPDLDKYHSLNWRVAKSAADGNTVNMQLRLYQGGATTLGGGTLIASFDRLDVSESFTTFHEHLSEAEAATISNYADLFVELEATVV